MRKTRSLKSQQRWTDKKLYPWVVASLVLTVVQHVFSLDLIGVGARYSLWITWLPLAVGLFVLAITRWRYLMARSSDESGAGWRVLLWSFMLVQGLLFSYTSFGLAARFIADILTRNEMRTGEVIHEQYPIHEAFMQGRGNRQHLTFFREGHLEMVHCGCVPEMADQRWDPPFDIVISTTPGILGTTVLLDYSWLKLERDEPIDK